MIRLTPGVDYQPEAKKPSRADIERARIRAILEAEPWAGGRGESEKRKAAREAKARNRRRQWEK